MPSENKPDQPQERRGGFHKGQSGNPGGRPKVVTELRALAQQHAPTAVKTLVEIMTNKRAPAPARVAASKELLDRGFGRPAQTVEVPEGGKAIFQGVVILPPETDE